MALCAYVWMHREDLRALVSIRIYFILLIALAQLISIVLNGVFLKILLNGFNILLRFFEYVSLSAVSSFSNMIFPFGGGFGVKVLYLKVLYGLEFAKFVGITSGLYIIIFCVISISGLLLLVDKWNTPFGMVLCIFLSSVTAMTIIAICLPSWICRHINFGFLGPSIRKMLEGVQNISRSKSELIRAFALVFCNVIVFCFATYIEFTALGSKTSAGVPVSFWDSALLSVVGSFALLVSITPAGLGVRESISIVIGSCIGISDGQVLAVCLLDRAVNFVVLAGTAGIGYLVLQARMRSAKSASDVIESERLTS
jgi:uncharacterized protein (TIRG00374 family)